jgi:hypothetical protein
MNDFPGIIYLPDVNIQISGVQMKACLTIKVPAYTGPSLTSLALP